MSEERSDEKLVYRWGAFYLQRPSIDVGISALVVLVIRYLDHVPGIARPPEGDELSELVQTISTSSWATFAALIAAMIFFYTLSRGTVVIAADRDFGDDVNRSWWSAILWTLVLAVTTTAVVDPIPQFGWALAFLFTSVVSKTLRVVLAVLIWIDFYRSDQRRHDFDRRLSEFRDSLKIRS